MYTVGKVRSRALSRVHDYVVRDSFGHVIYTTPTLAEAESVRLWAECQQLRSPDKWRA